MKIDLKEKVVIVTGAANGIGYAIAKAFFNCGAKVVICGRREPLLKQAIKDIEKEVKEGHGKIVSIRCDMSKEEDVRILVQKTIAVFQRLDIFINNAGTWSSTPIHEVKEEDIMTLVKNNLVTTILGTKYAAEGMKDNGVIINIGSFAGILPQRGSSIYASVKSAVHNFTRSSAAELAGKKIRVNCVIPGVIRTSMTSDLIDKNTSEILLAIPLGRVGTPEDVAPSVLFLASDLAQYITGASLEVTGGKYAIQL